MTFQEFALWPANTMLDFVLMLFGSPYVYPDIRVLLVGVIAVSYWLEIVRFIIKLIHKLFRLR